MWLYVYFPQPPNRFVAVRRFFGFLTSSEKGRYFYNGTFVGNPISRFFFAFY